jgi:hypothetical protein
MRGRTNRSRPKKAAPVADPAEVAIALRLVLMLEDVECRPQ